MRRGLVAVVAVAVTFLASTVAYAGWGCGWGGNWSMTGSGQTVSTQKMRSFQKDTLAIRENLMGKQFDLQDELSMEVPDGKRIAALRKEIISLQSQLQAAGDKYGMADWETAGSSGHHQSAYAGCGCGMCGW